MRLFVAVYPVEAAAADFAAFVSGLDVGQAAERGVNARLATRPTWHVTLAFLGEVPDARQDEVEAAIGRAVRGCAGPPAVRLTGGGRFGRGRFTVLWAGLAGDVDALRALSERVRRELKRARLPVDRKPFRPHLTVARPGDRLDAEALGADLAALETYEGPQWTVPELRLVRSHLGPKPRYDQLASWPLTGGG